MKITAKTISLVSTFANIFLSAAKLISGFAFGSVALIASGIDSFLDIASSTITFFGIRIGSKPADKEHPYGHARYESLASYTIVMLITGSALWVLYEAITNLFQQNYHIEYSSISIAVISASIIITEILARLKYYFGHKYSSLILVTDGKHSRADVLSQLAILGSLFLSRYYQQADSILAAFVSIYIIWSTYKLAKESIDSLVDKSNPELEKNISNFLKANHYNFSGIKTRRIGDKNYAEIVLILKNGLKTKEITSYLAIIEKELMRNFNDLTQILITIDAHNISESYSRNWLDRRMHFQFAKQYKNIKKLDPKKDNIHRIIIPYDNNDFSQDFGAKQYLMIDVLDGNKITDRQVVENPFYDPEEKSGHGTRFAKYIDADEVVVRIIGEEARKNLEAQHIQVNIIKNQNEIKSLVNTKIAN